MTNPMAGTGGHHRRHRKATVLLVLSALLQLTATANGASLEIMPSGEVQTKPVGDSFILTCKPDVEDPRLITNIDWKDPMGRVIDPQNTNGGVPKPTMYTEKHEDNSKALVFNSLQEEQAGRYTCIANYANTEQMNKSVSIETIEAITWVDAPENQNPILGQDFRIKCHVRARPSPSVDWFFAGDPIRTDDHYIIETHALKIKNVRESDDGVYTCRASVLTTGQLRERVIRVEVHIRPVIQEHSSSVEVIEGESASILCNATGKPAPKYTWVKTLMQEDLSSANRFSVNSDTGMLTIGNVLRDDDGEYKCTARNAAGEANMNIRVNVIVKPKIVEFANQTSAVDGRVELRCRAFGRPLPEIGFRKHTSERRFVSSVQPDDDRIVLSSQEDDIGKGETVGVLSIDRLQRSDDGLYECVASNKGGSAFKNGHLTVEFPPVFPQSNRTVWTWDQRPVNLTCTAESIPNATIIWNLFGDQRVERFNWIKQIGTGPSSTLTVTPYDRSAFANYKCVATNKHGTREHVIELREATRPEKILQDKVVEVTATTMRFELLLPATPAELPVRSVTIQYKEPLQPWSVARNRTWAAGSMYVIENLTPNTQYEYRISVTNDVGTGPWSDYKSEHTPQRAAPAKPKLPDIENKEYDTTKFSGQYELRWFTPADNGARIEKFEIRYCQVKRVDGDWEVQGSSCRTKDVKSSTSTHEYLKNLYPDTFYRVELKAYNALGFSEPSVMVFKTSRGQGTMVIPHNGPLISSGAIIGIVIAILIIIMVVIDIICCCANKSGIIFYICERSRRKPVDEEDAKLGSLYGWRFPLPYCDQKMANVAGVTAIQDSGSGKNTIRLVKHTTIDEKEPLKEEKKITPIIDSGPRRETSVTYDVKRSVSKTGFVGKDSAV